MDYTQLLIATNNTLAIANDRFSKQIGLLGRNLTRRIAAAQAESKRINATLSTLEQSALRRAKDQIKALEV